MNVDIAPPRASQLATVGSPGVGTLWNNHADTAARCLTAFAIIQCPAVIFSNQQSANILKCMTLAARDLTLRLENGLAVHPSDDCCTYAAMSKCRFFTSPRGELNDPREKVA